MIKPPITNAKSCNVPRGHAIEAIIRVWEVKEHLEQVERYEQLLSMLKDD